MRNFLISILLLLATMGMSAQSVTYAYDNAGNRTGRALTAAKAPQTPQTPEEVQSLTELPELLAKKDFVIYPNPTDGIFTVATGDTHQNLEGEACLYDMSGRLVEKQTIHSNHSHKKWDFNLTHQAAGVYILNIHLGESSFTWQIIKK